MKKSKVKARVTEIEVNSMLSEAERHKFIEDFDGRSNRQYKKHLAKRKQKLEEKLAKIDEEL